MRPLFILFCLVIGFAACNDVEIGKAKDVDAEGIYYDYQISGEEGRENATVKLQYRFGGPNGTTLVLDEPSKVMLDGITLKVDSARYSGAYYEVTKPIESVKGKHTIVFVDNNKKEHTEEFNFEPFSLAAEIPGKIKRKPFIIKLNNFPLGVTPIRLVLTDTSFRNASINEIMTVEKGEVNIDETKLSKLAKGPITVEIYREEERPVSNGSKEGGRISITYGLKRRFELTD